MDVIVGSCYDDDIVCDDSIQQCLLILIQPVSQQCRGNLWVNKSFPGRIGVLCTLRSFLSLQEQLLVLGMLAARTFVRRAFAVGVVVVAVLRSRPWHTNKADKERNRKRKRERSQERFNELVDQSLPMTSHQ